MKTIITTFIFSIITLISSAQLKTGDKVLYEGGATGLSNGTYFINTIYFFV